MKPRQKRGIPRPLRRRATADRGAHSRTLGRQCRGINGETPRLRGEGAFMPRKPAVAHLKARTPRYVEADSEILPHSSLSVLCDSPSRLQHCSPSTSHRMITAPAETSDTTTRHSRRPQSQSQHSGPTANVAQFMGKLANRTPAKIMGCRCPLRTGARRRRIQLSGHVTKQDLKAGN